MKLPIQHLKKLILFQINSYISFTFKLHNIKIFACGFCFINNLVLQYNFTLKITFHYVF